VKEAVEISSKTFYPKFQKDREMPQIVGRSVDGCNDGDQNPVSPE
jgi:hypothetical protein